MELDGLKYLMVGSGFFGAVIAERIANDLDELNTEALECPKL